jgi:hypothetical protein
MYIGLYYIIYYCQILMKLEYSRQIFEKSSNTKLHGNPSSGSGFFHANGQTDGHDEVNSRFSQFCE